MGLKNKITYEYLKQHIGCTKVFEHYFGSFDLSTSYHSPLRKDNKKSVGFFINDNGSVVYNDFAEDTKYNFVQFVAKLLNISYYGAIEHITTTFKLNVSRLTNFNNSVVQPVRQVKKKPKSVFKVVTKPFTKEDLQWWGQFAITKQELIDNNVYSVAKYNINDYTIYTQKNELRFAYLLKDNDTGSAYFKIYTPLDKERKWMFNGKLDLVYGLDKLSCGNLTQPLSV